MKVAEEKLKMKEEELNKNDSKLQEKLTQIKHDLNSQVDQLKEKLRDSGDKVK